MKIKLLTLARLYPERMSPMHVSAREEWVNLARHRTAVAQRAGLSEKTVRSYRLFNPFMEHHAWHFMVHSLARKKKAA